MTTPKEVQGALVLNLYSTNNGVTWKTIVCEDTSNISSTATVNEKKTKCATFTSTDIDAVKVTGSGVAGGDLDASQASYLDIVKLVNAKTKVLFQRYNDTDGGTIAKGEITYFEAYGYFNEATETSADGEVTSFNWAFISTGTVKYTATS